MTPQLSILCVSAGADYAVPFVDEMRELALELDAPFVLFDGRGADVIEHVLDDAVRECPNGYVLRLDDDERVSGPMRAWLAAGEYLAADHWSFPRAHLYPDVDHYVTTAPLWPDLQTRLSIRAKSAGRRSVHAGSPWGAGRTAPVVLEHYKFLVRPFSVRVELVEHYERLQAGAGRGFEVFSVPELFDLAIADYPAAVAA